VLTFICREVFSSVEKYSHSAYYIIEDEYEIQEASFLRISEKINSQFHQWNLVRAPDNNISVDVMILHICT